MSATAHEIRIHAMFPSHPGSDPSTWEWVHCLTFPVDTLNNLQLSLRPYKWIRYATGVVVGAHGDLSLCQDLPNDVIDYDAGLRSESVDLFYHISEAERQRMFPADPHINHTNCSSSEASPQTAGFCQNIVARDGTCVILGFHPLHCQAAHLLPHSKGNEYIQTYTRLRSRDESGVVNDIDDIRNGILLNVTAYITFGECLAFLVTPNFAMDSTDIDPTATPDAKRCTLHCFDPDYSYGYPPGFFSPPVYPARISNSADWPPDVLFDAVYAGVVIHHFASPTLPDALKPWESTFYPGGTGNAAQVSHQAIVEGRAVENKKKKEQVDVRRDRVAKRVDKKNDTGDFDTWDMLIDPSLFLPPDKREGFRRAAEEKRLEAEQIQRSRLEDKVARWARGVGDAS